MPKLTIGHNPKGTEKILGHWFLGKNWSFATTRTLSQLGMYDFILGFGASRLTVYLTWRDWREIVKKVIRWWGDSPAFPKDDGEYIWCKYHAKFLVWTMFRALLLWRDPVIEIS